MMFQAVRSDRRHFMRSFSLAAAVFVPGTLGVTGVLESGERTCHNQGD